jgi:uncharacterized protein YjbI with pentapeptide repeats
MASDEHLDILLQGRDAWHKWRATNPTISAEFGRADLCHATLLEMDLRNCDFRQANLSHANLQNANLLQARLEGANLQCADLTGAALQRAELTQANLKSAILVNTKADAAHFIGADLSNAILTGISLIDGVLAGTNLQGSNFDKAKLQGADLRGAQLFNASLVRTEMQHVNLRESNLMNANLTGADLRGADLWKADLTGANLMNASLLRASLVQTKLDHANLTGCRIYGIGAWNVSLEGSIQSNLHITPFGEPDIQVDNLEVAQLIYLLLNKKKISKLIDTITSKVVLILGRFTPERMIVLEAIRDGLRKRDYLPVLFDFEKPDSRDLTETISTLAHMARFIIADITDARGIPQELGRIIPDLPSVPVQPLLLASQSEYGMFEHFRHYPWVLEPVLYESPQSVLAMLEDRIINPADQKVRAQRADRA